MTDGVSDDDDNSESKSVDSMANRKRKLNTILCSNKRMHVEQAIGKTDTDIDSDSNHEANEHGMSINDNDDGASSRMSDFDDGKALIALVKLLPKKFRNLIIEKCNCFTTGNASMKNRTFTDTNDASFDSSYSAYLQETKSQLAKSAQPPMNLSQSLSNIVDVSALSLAKDKYFEKPTMVSMRSTIPISFSHTHYVFRIIHFDSDPHLYSRIHSLFSILICVYYWAI